MNLVPGQKVTAVILHTDLLSTCVHVSILSRLLGKKRSVSFTTVTVFDVYVCIFEGFYFFYNS